MRGCLAADDLKDARQEGRSATQIDRSFKYDAILHDDKLGVTEIFELDGSPCIYFKSLGAEPSSHQLSTWHRAAWNHGLARMLWVTTPTHIRIFNAFAPPRHGDSEIHDPEVESSAMSQAILKDFGTCSSRVTLLSPASSGAGRSGVESTGRLGSMSSWCPTWVPRPRSLPTRPAAPGCSPPAPQDNLHRVSGSETDPSQGPLRRARNKLV